MNRHLGADLHGARLWPSPSGHGERRQFFSFGECEQHLFSVVGQIYPARGCMLVILSGLPGTGKTTIGKRLAAKRCAAYVRVDEIEHALAHGTKLDLDFGPTGYIVAFAIALSNLRLGNLVVGDSVNPVSESRQGWRDVARNAGIGFVDVEIICSNEHEHQRRVETRIADIAGFVLPSWASVRAHTYVPWASPRLVVDTAVLSPDEAIAVIEAQIDDMLGKTPSTLRTAG